MNIQRARIIADGDVMNTDCQTLSDAFDVLRASSEKPHLNRLADFARAKRLWALGD